MQSSMTTLVGLLLLACTTTPAEPPLDPSPSTSVTDTTSPPGEVDPGTALVDPRRDGLTIALGEWAVSAEATEIRPGRVTFVVTNSGTMRHGFRIRSDREDESGGDRFERRTRLLEPGETARMRVNLRAGPYEIDCFVEGHDDRGMQARFRVSPDAPLVRPEPARAGSVTIEGFAFEPASMTVAPGVAVRWTNDDAAPHTVTSDEGTFDSGTIAQGQAFEHTFTARGSYAYHCTIHPSMTGSVLVR